MTNNQAGFPARCELRADEIVGLRVLRAALLIEVIALVVHHVIEADKEGSLLTRYVLN